MSIVIIGGHERMETQYKQICKKYKCKAKVFTKMKGNLKEQIGKPDLMILFTATASHKMVHCAVAVCIIFETYDQRRNEESYSADFLLFWMKMENRWRISKEERNIHSGCHCSPMTKGAVGSSTASMAPSDATAVVTSPSPRSFRI